MEPSANQSWTVKYGGMSLPAYLTSRLQSSRSKFYPAIPEGPDPIDACAPFFKALRDGPARAINLTDPRHRDENHDPMLAYLFEIGTYDSPPPRENVERTLEAQEHFLPDGTDDHRMRKLGLILAVDRMKSDLTEDPHVNECLVM